MMETLIKKYLLRVFIFIPFFLMQAQEKPYQGDWDGVTYPFDVENWTLVFNSPPASSAEGTLKPSENLHQSMDLLLDVRHVLKETLIQHVQIEVIFRERSSQRTLGTQVLQGSFNPPLASLSQPKTLVLTFEEMLNIPLFQILKRQGASHISLTLKVLKVYDAQNKEITFNL